MIKKYYDSDCNLSLLDGKTVAVIGFGDVYKRQGLDDKERTPGRYETAPYSFQNGEDSVPDYLHDHHLSDSAYGCTSGRYADAG